MATAYKNVDLIKELIANKRLSMVDGKIFFDGRKRKTTSHSVVVLPLEKGRPFYPNCYMVAYIIQGGGEILASQKVVPIEGTSLLFDNLKLVDKDRSKQSHSKNLKFSIEILAQIRREYRNRFIVPCSFSILKKKYKICSAQIVNILYNTSTNSVWGELSKIEPPLAREDSRKYISGSRGRPLSQETKEKLRKASLAWHASHPSIKPYSNQNRPVKPKQIEEKPKIKKAPKPKVDTKPIPSNYELLKAALEKEIRISKNNENLKYPRKRSIFSNNNQFLNTFSEEEFNPAEAFDKSTLNKTE